MVAISVRLDMGREARMGFAGDGPSVYPIVNSDLMTFSVLPVYLLSPICNAPHGDLTIDLLAL
jgi:hypothetical protein